MQRTFRVYFKDGNQRLFEASSMAEVLRFICGDLYIRYGIIDIAKIEEVIE